MEVAYIRVSTVEQNEARQLEGMKKYNIEKYFTEKPARSCVAVKTLPKNVLCEVEVIAEVE